MNHTNHWKGNDGDLFFDANFERWIFYRGSLTITITPWTYTEKGSMTELHLSSAGHEVIIEVVERRFNKELCSPDQPDKTATKVMELIKLLSSIDMDCSPYLLILSLPASIEEVAKHFVGAKFIHVYYGTGLSYGIKITLFGNTKKLDAIPPRCLEFPGKRLDTV